MMDITREQWAMAKEPVRLAMIGSLMFASYLVWKCPCSAPVGCQQGTFYAALLAPAAATFVLNLSPNVRT